MSLNHVSAIVCTRDRKEALASALESMAALELEGVLFDLVVVDNGSTDGTDAMVRLFAATSPFPVICVQEPKPGLSRARNAGIAAAPGRILLFTDDDCVVTPQWIKAAAAILGPDPMRVIGGRVELYNPGHLPLTIKTSTSREELRSRTAATGFIHGANFGFGRCVVDRIGLFDVRLGAGSAFSSAEDLDYYYRALCAGIPVSYEPGMVVHHNHGRTTKADWYKLMRGYAIGNGAAMMKHLLLGQFDLFKEQYWALQRIFGRGNGARTVALLLLLWLVGLGGALKFLLVASWRSNV